MIYNKTKFEECPAMEFDGLFDWDWTEGCFGQKFIRPMDIDGMTERKGNFLIFETKSKGNPIPAGQYFTLDKLYRMGVFTIVFCDKVNPPTQLSVWTAPGLINDFGTRMKCPQSEDKKVFYPEYTDISEAPQKAVNFIKKWYEFANNNPKK